MRLAALGARHDAPDDDGRRARPARASVSVHGVADDPRGGAPRLRRRRARLAALGRATTGRRDLAGGGPPGHARGGRAAGGGAEVACGGGGFAEDTAPADALVAVPDGRGGWAVGESLAEARGRAGTGPGAQLHGGAAPSPGAPPGDWDLTLRTTFVEPAYLEPDASWCAPGGEPATPLANGGAFGGKAASPVAAVARRLADEHGPAGAGRVLPRGRGALRAQAPPDRGRRPRPTGRG